MKLPGANAVHLWYVSLNQTSPAPEALVVDLATDEPSRMRRFHFADDARRYAARRGVLRRLVGAYLDLPAASVLLDYGLWGKSHLAGSENAPALHFNRSSSSEPLK